MAVEVSWVHGNVVIPERIDDGRLARVDGIAWTDRVGNPKGWGRIYVGQNGSENWFHAMVPTPVIDDDVPIRVERAFVTFNSAIGRAEIRNFHVYDGPWFIFANDAIRVSGNYEARQQPGENDFAIPSTPNVRWGLGISVRVVFSDEARITFHGAGARFLSH